VRLVRNASAVLLFLLVWSHSVQGGGFDPPEYCFYAELYGMVTRNHEPNNGLEAAEDMCKDVSCPQKCSQHAINYPACSQVFYAFGGPQGCEPTETEAGPPTWWYEASGYCACDCQFGCVVE
jgi:hypothetical protein